MNYNQKAKEASELADKLSNIKKEELPAILPKIPEYINSEYELVRIEAVELIGDFKLKQFLGEVQSALNDESELVRKYALSAMYDLIGNESAPFLEKALSDRNPHVTTKALALLYVITEDPRLLDHLLNLLKEEEWQYNLCSTAFSTFETYTSVKDYEGVVDILQKILPHLKESDALYKEISSIIND